MPLHFSPDQIQTPLYHFEHQAMACDWEIWIAHEDDEYARQAAFAAWEEVDRIETDLSRFREGSDVRRLNGAAPGETIRVGLHARECLLLAGEISGLTGGAFEPMVARAMDEIRAGRPSGPDLLPLEPLLEIDPLNGAVTILGEGVALDFGALGKGYAIDCLIEILREWNIESALAHAGTSSVYALGTPPESDGWPLALRHPQDEASIITTLILRDAALGGSGFDVKGRHILDPRSGLQVEGKIASWCLCQSAARADAFSTAFLVMNRDEITEFSQNLPHVSGLVLEESNAGVIDYRWGAFENLELNSEALRAKLSSETNAVPHIATDPLLQKHLNQRVTIVWKDQIRRSGILSAASRDWLQLQSDDGLQLLVPREAISWLEIENASLQT
ncbi:MAG TPA: FAD:protein FMN transferase [Abditibacteriaceae bacterium]|jgi:thiamine biosynthesis lipoprotein